MECKKYYLITFVFFISMLLFTPAKSWAVADNPLDALPTGSQKPEELGWYKVGESTGGFHCFDLSHLPEQDSVLPSNIMPPEEVRYVMFLNNSSLSSYHSYLEGGADPDGVVALNTKDSSKSGYVVWNDYPLILDSPWDPDLKSLEINASVFANSVTALKMGMGLGTSSWGCDQTSGASHPCGSDINFSDNPLGVINTTVNFLKYMNCGACALGNDPNPGWWGAEGGYIILDMACSSVSGISCSSQSAEDSGRVIVNGPGDDFCISETGVNESFRVYALPYELDPYIPCTCSPTCPADLSAVETGPYCADAPATCNCTDSNGDVSTYVGSTCYLPETNKAPEEPEYMYYCEDGTSNCTQLSQDSNNPTVILLPESDSTVQIATSTVDIPEGSNSRGIEYYINVNNQNGSSNPDERGWNPGACGSDVFEYDYCSGWQTNPYTIDLRGDIGMQEGARYETFAYSSSLNRCDDGRKASGRVYGYFIIDYSPEIDDVMPDVSGNEVWIGTEVDEDVTYGVDCSATPDNNPFTFKVTASDQNGSSDIESLQANLAESDQLNSGTYDAIKWPMRIWFKANNDSTEDAFFAVRDADVSESPSDWTDQHCCSYDDRTCNINITGNCQPGGGNCYCWKVDSHNWDSANYLGSQSYDGHNVNVYYLDDDINVYTDDHEIRLIGNSNWRNATKVMYEIGGNNVWAEYMVAFDGEEENNNLEWEGSYKNVWYVADVVGAEDEDLESGESLYQWCSDSDVGNSRKCTDFIINGDTRIDMVAPDIKDPEIEYGAGSSSCGSLNYDDICYTQTVTEERYRPSRDIDLGISQVIGRSYEVVNNGVTRIAENLANHAITPIDYETVSHDKISDLIGEDVLHLRVNAAVDNVCNISQLNDETISVGSPWIATTDGDVYSALGYSLNIAGDYPDGSGNHALSYHWIGSGNVLTGISGSVASLLRWESSSYSDNNKSVDWYAELNRLASNSECVKLDDCNIDTESSMSDVLSADRGIYHLSGNQNIASGSEFSNAKVIFIDGNLTIQPQFGVNSISDADSGCLFVVRGDVTLGKGDDHDGDMSDPDRIYAAFVVNGEVNTPDDPVYDGALLKADRLVVDGFVFANNESDHSTSFNRDLVFEDNTEYPAEAFEYDPRYLSILKDMLSSKGYKQFECGIVHDSDACDNWDLF